MRRLGGAVIGATAGALLTITIYTALAALPCLWVATAYMFIHQ